MAKIRKFYCVILIFSLFFNVVFSVRLIQPATANQDLYENPDFFSFENYDGKTINFFPMENNHLKQETTFNVAADAIIDESITVYGDINGDKSVNVGDAIMILRHIVGLTDLEKEYGFEPVERLLAKREDNLNVSHAITLLRYIVGLESGLKISEIFHENCFTGLYLNVVLSIIGPFDINELNVYFNEAPLAIKNISTKILGVEVPAEANGYIRAELGEKNSNSFFFSPFRDDDLILVESEIETVIENISQALQEENIEEALNFFSIRTRNEYEEVFLDLLTNEPDILDIIAENLRSASINFLSGTGYIYDADTRIAEYNILINDENYRLLFVLEENNWLLEIL